MSRIGVSFELNPVATEKVLRRILRDIIQKLNHDIRDAIPRITTKVKAVTQIALRKSPMYHGIVSGDLRGHFGFPEGEELDRIDEVIDTIADDIAVRFKFFELHSNTISGNFTISITKKT